MKQLLEHYCQIPQVQEFFREKMGTPRPYDHIICLKKKLVSSQGFSVRIDCDYVCPGYIKTGRRCKSRIIIPLPVDDYDSRRGLCGMLEDDLRGMMRINGNQWVCETYDKKPTSQIENFVADTLTECLLKAICWKIGVKGENL